MRAWAVGICGLAIFAAHRGAEASLTAIQTHTLTSQCAWAPKPWARVLRLQAVNEDQPSIDALEVCFARRGLKSPSPFLKTIVPHWPHGDDLRAP